MPSLRRARVLLLIPHLGGGGAEHVIATLAESLDPERFEVHLGLVTQDRCDAQDAPRVAVHCLGRQRVRGSAPGLLRLVWRLRPELILSGIAHLNLLVLLLRPMFPKVVRVLVRQNGSLAPSLAGAGYPAIARLLFRRGYRRADGVICQSDAMAQELRARLGLHATRLLVLPNPVDIEGVRSVAESGNDLWNTPGPRLLAVGRLEPEKGFDLLIEAFARLLHRFPDAELVIAGRGQCAAALRTKCRALGIEGSVRFAGQIRSPAIFFRDATAFVLSSRDEGLPNALLEAAAVGLPVVALPASRTVEDLLRGRSGVWMGSAISAEALEQILERALLSLKPGQRFRHAWTDAFDRSTAIKAYEDAIEMTIREQAR